VPYARGDLDGDLTASVIRELSASPYLRYSPTGARYLICLDVVNYCDQNIGFQYELNKNKNLRHSVVPSETRLTVKADMIVRDAFSQQVVLGPIGLEASWDFDHDWYSSTGGINTFSLGQFTDIDTARDTVLVPLHKRLAKKVIDYLAQTW
jgi:hypothetical protein